MVFNHKVFEMQLDFLYEKCSNEKQVEYLNNRINICCDNASKKRRENIRRENISK